MSPSVSVERRVASPKAMERLGAEIALWLKPGDLVALEGPVGAGKSVLSRAIITALGGTGDMPSPTFTLVQSYGELRIPLAHFDLYRIGDPGEIEELGLDEVLAGGAALVEWAERAAGRLPADRLTVAITDEGGEARAVTLTGHGAFSPRLARAAALADFITRSGWSQAERHWLKGDASMRSYERLEAAPASVPATGDRAARDRAARDRAVVMNAPRGADGPPVRGGLPYSRVAHLAEDVAAFVAIDSHLAGLGLSVPTILASDLAAGFLLLEDLGDELYGTLIAAGGDVRAPYEAVIEALAVVHGAPPPLALPAGEGRVHTLPRYDLEAMLIEAELLIDWTLPALTGRQAAPAAREAYRGLWREAIESLSGPQVLVLRDVHSPNLLWLGERQGAARAGIIDFQDALAGHPAYDLVSLAQDARVNLPDGLEAWLMQTYLARRPPHAAGIPADVFAGDYAILGAQRAAKIIGIFTRLALRDRKDIYLAHIPRVVRYFRQNLAHARLAPLARWIASEIDLDRDVAAAVRAL